LRDFQAQGESPACGLFHGAAFSTAHLPTNSAKEPQFAQVGQSGLFGAPILPPLTYQFNFVDAHDWEHYFDTCANSTASTRRYPGKWNRTIESIRSCVRRVPAETKGELFTAFLREVLPDQRLLKQSIRQSMSPDESIALSDFRVAVHQTGDDTFKVETDLQERLQQSELRVHKIVEAGLFGVCGLVLNLSYMKSHCAISGFPEREMPLFRSKLDYLASAYSSDTTERKFQRVMEIAGLSELAGAKGVRVKADKLLKLRESSECREFRDWLPTIGSASDADIRVRVRSMNACCSTFLQGSTGKVLRFLVTSASGLHPALGLATSAVDCFLIDRLFPRSGIAAFVGKSYPSIFQSAQASRCDQQD
jgi:hypothetical protein